MSTMMHDLEALYRETGNPIYVWKAFAEECRQGEPLPGWIEDYLRECAGHLIDMAEAERRFTPEPGKRPVSPSEAAQRTPQGLGLTRIGWNAFAEYRDNERNARVAWLRETRPRPIKDSWRSGSLDPEVEFLPEGRRPSIKSLARRAEVAPRTVHDWIDRAKKLWNAQ